MKVVSILVMKISTHVVKKKDTQPSKRRIGEVTSCQRA